MARAEGGVAALPGLIYINQKPAWRTLCSRARRVAARDLGKVVKKGGHQAADALNLVQEQE